MSVVDHTNECGWLYKWVWLTVLTWPPWGCRLPPWRSAPAPAAWRTHGSQRCRSCPVRPEPETQKTQSSAIGVMLNCAVVNCTVSYCTELHHTVLCLSYCTVLYHTVLYCVILYCMVSYCTVPYHAMLYGIILHWMVPYSIILYCIVSYCAVWSHTV